MFNIVFYYGIWCCNIIIGVGYLSGYGEYIKCKVLCSVIRLVV